MEYRRLGNTGMYVSEISYGNWITHGNQVEATAANACVKAAFDAGITTFDTADVYAGTKAETILGKALKGVRRESYELFTKVYFPTGTGKNDRGLSRKHIIESCNASLKRLQTDHIDLYQAHRFDYETPLELTVQQIKDIIQDYKQAAIHAIEAGFDGIELHAAFGYLPNQFLAESSNQRTDEYGGSIENRNRFVVEIMEEIVSAIGEGKVAIRLSPTSTYNSIIHQQPIEQFTALISSLNALSLSYLHIMNVPYNIDQFPQYPQHIIEFFANLSKHPIMANCGYTRETGEAELVKGHAEMISYGTLFIANPDLPKRFELNAGLNEVDKTTMYSGQDKGYIDYPFLHN